MGGGGGGFEAYGEAITLGTVAWGPFSVVGPSYSVVRRDGFELAVLASFNCPDGSLFIQEITRPRPRPGQGQINDVDDDGLTLTLFARDGNRYRFPPFVCSFAKPLTPSMEVQLKVTVLNRTRDYVSETWNNLERNLLAKAKQRLFEAQRQGRFDPQLEAQVSQHLQRLCKEAQLRHQFEAQHHLVNSMQNINLGP